MDETLIGGESSSFVSYMFSLSEGEKVDLLNMFQYLVLAIIPILLVNKFISVYIPLVDRSKSTFEVTTELLIQLVVLFTFIYFIHKLILFIPTYSKNPYPSINFLPIVLPVLLILFSLDKNMNEKSNILLNRLFVMLGITKENFQDEYEEECTDKKRKKKKNHENSQGEMMEPPASSSRVLINRDHQEPPSKNSDYEVSQNGSGQQFGISEPAAANDYGGFCPF
jgi:hypothetical protein